MSNYFPVRKLRVGAGLMFCVWLLGCKEGAGTSSAEGKEQTTLKAPQEASSAKEEAKLKAAAPAREPAPAPAHEPRPAPWVERVVASSGFPCEVEAVLSTSCRRCHWDPQENDAPFPLVKWEDTQKMRSGKPIHALMNQMVAADLMPPLDALVEPSVEPLSAEHKKAMLTWLESGAKKSDEVCQIE